MIVIRLSNNHFITMPLIVICGSNLTRIYFTIFFKNILLLLHVIFGYIHIILVTFLLQDSSVTFLRVRSIAFLLISTLDVFYHKIFFRTCPHLVL